MNKYLEKIAEWELEKEAGNPDKIVSRIAEGKWGKRSKVFSQGGSSHLFGKLGKKLRASDNIGNLKHTMKKKWTVDNHGKVMKNIGKIDEAAPYVHPNLNIRKVKV